MRFRYSLLLLAIPFLAAAQYVHPTDGDLFINTEVPRIDIIIADDDIDFILDPSNENSDTEFPATFIFSSSSVLDTIEGVGFRLRGNTSRASAKKSFKISFNSFEKGKKYGGVEKLNLNGEHNDPSIIRSDLAWDLFEGAGVPASRSNHVALYINQEYRGLYINVEHVDEEFIQKRFSEARGNLWKCLWPADLHYQGPNPVEYSEPEPWGRRAYDLKTNTLEFDYTSLAHFIDVLNNYSGEEFICEMERIFDVDNYLRVIAIDVLSGNWDGPIVNKNNFYLYHNPLLDRLTYIPFDLDNTFGIDWFGINWETTDIYNWSDNSGEYRPLYEKIMAIPEWRNRYSFILDTYIEELFSANRLSQHLDQKLELISPHRVSDVFAEQDYGYTHDDFLDSYTGGLGAHAGIGLKPYINTRINSVRSQLQIESFAPAVFNLGRDWSLDSINFLLNYYDDGSVDEITFHYNIEEQGWQSQTLLDFDDIEASYVFVVEEQGEMIYYFELKDDEGMVSNYPRCQNGRVFLGYDVTPDLVINEFMASNTSKVQDAEGEYEDWIELYNNSNAPIDLRGKYLSDDPADTDKWRLPSRQLFPSQYLIIWADKDAEQGLTHADFKLAKEGEHLGIYDSYANNFAPIDTLTFPAQETDVSYARLPNGVGDFAFAPFMTFDFNNDSPSSTEDDSLEEFYVYPNPTTDYLYFSDFTRVENFKLFSSDGSLILEGGESFIEVNKFQSGLYFLQLHLKNGQILRKSITIF